MWRVPSATSWIPLPQYQHVAVGDGIADGPEHLAYWRVKVVEPERALVYWTLRHPWRGAPVDPTGASAFSTQSEVGMHRSSGRADHLVPEVDHTGAEGPRLGRTLPSVAQARLPPRKRARTVRVAPAQSPAAESVAVALDAHPLVERAAAEAAELVLLPHLRARRVGRPIARRGPTLRG